MKITFLVRSITISGGLRAVLKLSDLLAKRGHDVEVTVGEGPKVSRKNFDFSRPLWQPTAARIRFASNLFGKNLRDSDVTIATAWSTAIALNSADARVGLKAYFIQHYESLFHGPKAKVDPTYRYGFYNIATSHWLKDLLREVFHAPSVLFITPVDLAVFVPGPVNRSSAFRICTLYSKVHWKRFETGLETIRLVRASGRPVELVLISAQPVSFDEPGVELHVGKSQGDLAEVFRSCDVYLSTSMVEGLGMPQMEAMACGCALVTTDTWGCRSYAVDGKNALIVDPASARGLADAIIRLYDNRKEMKKFQRAGMRKISSFSWDKAVKKLEAGFIRQIRRTQKTSKQLSCS